MTLVSSLILDAFREGNIIPLTAAPNANQQTEALRLYNQNVSSIYGSEAGSNLEDWPLGTYGIDQPGYTDPRTIQAIQQPPGNRRLIVSNAAAMTVYLPVNPQDGARMYLADVFGRLATVPVTLDANGRLIDGNPTELFNTNGTFQEWFYRADLGQWMKLSNLLATDTNPFPQEFDVFFYIGLAMRLNPRYGREMDPATANVFKSQRNQFMARYMQSEPLEILDDVSWPFMSRQSYNPQRTFTSNQNWNQGFYGGAGYRNF